MSKKIWMFAVAVVATMSVAAAALAAGTTKTHASHAPGTTPGSTKSMRKETITIDVRGAETAESAKALSDALAVHNVNAPIEAGQGAPVRTTASIDRTTDLGSCSQAMTSASTSGNKSTAAPSLDLVLFAKLGADSQKKVTDALAKVKGIDAQQSKVDVEKGEVTIRIAGGSKVTADQLRKVLIQAGIQAQFTKSPAVPTT